VIGDLKAAPTLSRLFADRAAGGRCRGGALGSSCLGLALTRGTLARFLPRHGFQDPTTVEKHVREREALDGRREATEVVEA